MSDWDPVGVVHGAVSTGCGTSFKLVDNLKSYKTTALSAKAMSTTHHCVNYNK